MAITIKSPLKCGYLISDILLLICTTFMLVLLGIIWDKIMDSSMKVGTYLLCFLAILFAFIFNIIVGFMNYIRDYKNHNKYGTMLKFFMLVLIVPTGIQIFLKSENFPPKNLKKLLKIYWILCFVTVPLILINFILGFLNIDKKLVKKIFKKIDTDEAQPLEEPIYPANSRGSYIFSFSESTDLVNPNEIA